MASDYISISKYNEDQLGKDRASRMSQVAMYADTAHFIYELLQNADDANATEIYFKLSIDQLIIEHDGTPFTEDNVKAISYFGKGKTDYTKIGHFGLGFKSVFAYTATPHVHSGSESFQITQLYNLAAIKYPDDLKHGRTRFVLPFDHFKKKPDYIEPRNLKLPDIAYNEIAKKLIELGGETLLFTKTLLGIHWVTEDEEGHYIRNDTSVDGDGREVCITTSDSQETYFLVFDKPVYWPDEKGNQVERRPVQIAFNLDKSLQDNGTIVPVENARLFVFFRTDKETHVGFILQGPYRTTPARDNVPTDDEFNQHLVRETQELLFKSLISLINLELFNLDTLSTFPIKHEMFKADNLFHSLYSLNKFLIEKTPMLPAAGGGFVAGSNAKLARGAELTEIFGATQLEQLFNVPGIQWINPKLTINNYPDLHRFLVGKKEPKTYIFQPAKWIEPPIAADIEVAAEDIAKLITVEFMKLQSDEWLKRFYNYLADSPVFRNFISKPIIRLEGDIHVVPFSESNVPNAFLPIEGTDDTVYDLPIVKRSLIKNVKVRHFLERQLNLTAPDIADVVLKSVLPKYRSGIKIPIQTWQKDFAQILIALQTDSYEKKARLKDVLQNTAFLLTERVGDEENLYLSLAQDAYLNNEENRIFFSGCGEIYLLAKDKYSLSDLEILIDLGVEESPRIHRKLSGTARYVSIKNEHGSHQRGLNNFDPDWEFDGLENAVNAPNLERSKLLWKYILPYDCCIRGTVEISSNQTFKFAKRKELISTNGKLLMETAWLPDKQGNFHIPSELYLDDLPDEFEKTTINAKELADKLGMLKSEEQTAIFTISGGDKNLELLIKAYKDGDDRQRNNMLKLIPVQRESTDFKTFKEGIVKIHRPQRQSSDEVFISQNGVTNSTRYQEKIDEATKMSVAEAKSTPQVIKFGLIRESSANTEARDFLYNQYQGRCQVTGQTFMKANGSNYFQAVVLVSRLDAEYLNHPGNMLSLSADTAAKFMYGGFEWLDDLEAKIQEFMVEKDGGEKVNRQIRIRMAGEDATITWTEQHFMRLISLWNNA